MTQKELFRVIDALNPCLSDIKDYLDRMCGVTPLELVYRQDGRLSFSTTYTADLADNLFGVAIPNTKKIVCIQTLNKKLVEILDLEHEQFPFEKVSEWLDKEFLPLKIRVARKNDIDVLYKHLNAFRATLDILQFKGFKNTPKVYNDGLAWIYGDRSTSCYDYDGSRRLSYHLTYCDILLFADLPAETTK